MTSFIAALQFLTICPVLSRFHCGADELRHSVRFFPIIGLLIGGVLALLAYPLGWLLPPLPASALMVILMLSVSRCLHMDGLADTADGFLSSRPKERILEIMKDSHTGAMGVIAVVCLIVLKVTALASVPQPLRLGCVFLMPLSGRCALVIASAVNPYARPEGGLASVFARPRWPAVLSTLLVLFAAAWLALRMVGLTSGVTAVLATLAFSLFCRRKIGGFTGDTLGAACEIAEVLPALIAASRI